MVEPFGIGAKPGWTGAFTTEEAEGALPNGTPVVKVGIEEGDLHQLGERGVILGSIRAPGKEDILYFVEWAASPRLAVATISWKVRQILH